MSLLSVFVAFLVVLPGLLAIINNPKDRKNHLFLGISVSLSLWVFFNALVDMFDSTALFFTRLTFIAITVGIVIFWDFTHYFPKHSKSYFPRSIAYGIALAMVVIGLSDLFIPRIEYVDGLATVVPGSLYILFIIYYLAFLIMALVQLVLNVHKNTGIERERTKLVLFAMLLLSTWSSLTNLILPLILGDNRFAPIGAYGTLAFTALIGYAMLKHQLFDVRAALARTFTYSSTLTALVVSYVSILYLITGLLGDRDIADNTERLLYLCLTIFTAAIFQPLRVRFDTITNKIFYRGDYNVQELLDEISGVIATTSKLHELLDQTFSAIEKYMNPEAIAFMLVSASEANRVFLSPGTSEAVLNKTTAKRVLSFNIDTKTNVLRTETITNRTMRHFLQRHHIELTINIGTKEQNVARMILANKKNGNAYTKKDEEVMDIIADELAVAIQNSLRYEEIASFNITLQEEVEDATRRMRHSNEKLKALDATKDEFISMASHQLRTPLTSVKGYLSMVLEGDAGKLNEQQTKLLTQAFISSQRMVYLISDLLNVSRLRTGKFVIEKTPTNLPEVISGELNQLHETAEARGLTLVFKKPKHFPLLHLDETKIRQVIMNFIDNAIYYTPAGGKIIIELEAKADSVEFRVIDDGIGVPKEEQRHLFTKFYRANNAKRARPDGTGLGLFMARKVVAAQGGAIVFKSAEGKGSTFGFTFPRATTEVAIKT
jgi:signal transduction histidine kinase